jgi:Na+/melibiose symporter-like transporter
MAASTGALSRVQLLGYGVFAFPLAMAALPIYLHAPRFYVETTTLGLGVVGLLFGLARLVDAVTDPLLGVLVDGRFASRGRRWALPLAIPLLAVGMLALFNPPASVAPGLWLLASVVVVSLGYSLASIAYQALNADLHDDPHQRTRLAATREGLGLLGVLTAALLPGLLVAGDESAGLGPFSQIFSVLLVVGLLLSWRFLASSRVSRQQPLEPVVTRRPSTKESLRRAWSDPGLRAILGVLLLSAGAGALTATLFPFFVADVLAAPGRAGPFLAAYFAAGVIGMPVWVVLGRRLGKAAAWQSGMLLAVVAFAGTAWLGPGDESLFLLFCLVSGLALGADLALASALLADLSRSGPGTNPAGQGGVYFGLWNLTMKLALGLAAAVALPLVAWLGYVPGDPGSARGPLLIGYVVLPCLLKIAAVLLIRRGGLRNEAPMVTTAMGREPCR